MGNKNKQKRSLSLDELKNIKLEGNAFVEKSEDEKKLFEKEVKSKNKSSSYILTDNTTNSGLKQKENIPNDLRSYAPYNFIPINEDVVTSEFNFSKVPSKDKYDKEKNNGFVELEINSKTPSFISDSLTKEEMSEIDTFDELIRTSSGHQRETYELQKINRLWEINSFHSPGGKYSIPGSSLRGMIRSTMEIISFSKFNQFEKDKKYHFRAFADKSLDLRQKYADLMIEQVVDDKAKPIGFAQQINAGYLINRNNEFTIIPAKEINGTQFFRVEEDLVIANIILQQRMKNKSKDKYVDNNRYKMGFKEVAFVPTNPQTHKHSKPLYYAKVTEIRNVENKTDKDLIGTLVHSGWMRGQREGKHLHWIVGPIDRNQSLTIPDLVIQNYKDDINRNEQANLLAYFKENRNVKVPCFYIESNGIIESFGHTGLFRLAYKYSLGDFIPKKNRDFDELDITTAIFGDTDHFSSRLFFEDSFLQEENFVGEKHPQILAGPKATSFQHYLVQTSFEKSFNYRNEYNGLTGLKDYNDANNTVLRGNKMYWHKEPEIWSNEADVNAKPKQYTKINPAASGTIFKGKIRFENLTDIELGALLFALDLPVGCAHKIGMGKPLGLGSIRITPKLFISNREERYKNLFSEWNENNESDSNKVNELKRKFEEYILENIDEKKDSLWDIDRLKELKAMLAFENKPKVSKTKYMALDEFRQRKVLPLPSEVIKQS